MNLEELLTHIRIEELEFGHELPNGISSGDIDKLKAWILEKYEEGAPLQDYYSMLQNINGFEYEGLFIYGFQPGSSQIDIVWNNEIWGENEWRGNYLFLGDGDMSWLALELDSGMFYELDKPSGTIMREFSSFEDMLMELIQELQ